MAGLSKTAACRGCGREIAFIKTANGKSIPVDPESVYFIPEEKGKKYVMIDGTVQTGRDMAEGDSKVKSRIGFVSHFATCPEADRFRKRK